MLKNESCITTYIIIIIIIMIKLTLIKDLTMKYNQDQSAINGYSLQNRQ